LPPTSGVEELEGSPAFLKAITGVAPVLLYVYDLETRRNIWVSSASPVVLGYSEEEVREMGPNLLVMLIHPDDMRRYPEHIDRLNRICRDGESSAFEYRMRKKNGDWVWLVSLETPYKRNERGEVVQVVGAAENITERKLSQFALEESEKRFRAFVTATADAVYRMNPDWTEMRRLDGKDFIADSHGPSRSWLEMYIPREERPLVKAAIDEAIREKKIFELEHRVKRVDGSIGWTLSRAVPMIDERGEITEWFGAARDVTDRKATEDALQLNEQRARQFDQEQNRALEMIAAGKPLGDCLVELTESVRRLAPGVRAGVVIAKADRGAFENLFSSSFPPRFSNEIRELTIQDRSLCTCATSIDTSEPVICSDLAGDSSWSEQWRSLCLEHGIRATYSSPVFGVGGRARASFFLALAEAREPNAWERRIAGFGAHAAGLALQRDEAQTQLEQSQKTLHEMVDRAPFGVYIVDSDFRIAHMNQGSRDGAFRNVRPVIGRDFSEAMRILWPEPVATDVINAFRHTLETGVPYYSPRFVNPRRDLGALEAYEWELHRMVMPDGRNAVICYYYDSTQLRLAEQALLESEERLRMATQTGKVGIWDWNIDANQVLWTDSLYKIHGVTRESFGGRVEDFGELIYPEDRERVFSSIRASLEGGEPYRLTFRAVTPDGEILWLFTNAVVLQEDGKPVRMLGATLDVTELKSVEEELRRANADLEQFAYSASHDLQEPLRSVRIFSELLAGRYREKLDGQALEFLDRVVQGASRMEILLRDLLAYSQAGRIDKPAEPQDANVALQAAMADLMVAISESEAVIESGPLPMLPVNETHLQQLFQNLLSNAIKYRLPGVAPRIQITVERQTGMWLFSVCDNGIGIEPEHQERIFGLFKRLHTSKQYSGTGIGLALCHRIVEQYRGRIWVESEPGRGSAFRFTLPV
jgi:PAS domain S-box-containing protein